VKLLAVFVLAIFLAVFCVANRSIVSLNLVPLPYIAELPLFIFALICIAVGVILGGVSASYQTIKTKCELRKTLQRNSALENEIKSLRMERNSSLTSSTTAISKNL